MFFNPKHPKDCGDGCRLSEAPHSAANPHSIQQPSVKCGLMQVSGINLFPGSEVGVQHQWHHWKCSAEDVLSTATTKAQKVLAISYTAAIKSICCTSIAVWFGAATKQDKCTLQSTIQTTKRIIDAPLPSLHDKDQEAGRQHHQYPTHPAHTLFNPLPSGRAYRSLHTKITRLHHSMHLVHLLYHYFCTMLFVYCIICCM